VWARGRAAIALGYEREIRLDAGLTARALALAAGWHESKCSRVEHVRTAPSEADVRLWCRICGAGDTVLPSTGCQRPGECRCFSIALPRHIASRMMAGSVRG
jgi:hypothetical protein